MHKRIGLSIGGAIAPSALLVSYGYTYTLCITSDIIEEEESLADMVVTGTNLLAAIEAILQYTESLSSIAGNLLCCVMHHMSTTQQPVYQH